MSESLSFMSCPHLKPISALTTRNVIYTFSGSAVSSDSHEFKSLFFFFLPLNASSPDVLRDAEAIFDAERFKLLRSAATTSFLQLSLSFLLRRRRLHKRRLSCLRDVGCVDCNSFFVFLHYITAVVQCFKTGVVKMRCLTSSMILHFVVNWQNINKTDLPTKGLDSVES